MIKKVFLTIALILSASYITEAQSNDYALYGVKGGLNLSNLNGVSSKLKPGFTAGIFAEYFISEGVSLRSEMLFAVQGAKSKNGTQKIKLNYINWPILAKLYATKDFSIEVGPQLGFLISGKGGGLPKSAYKTLDVGAALGVNYRLNQAFEIGARYNHGLTDITKTSGKLKNRVVQLSLAYSFN
jgi:hypothetical protein